MANEHGYAWVEVAPGRSKYMRVVEQPGLVDARRRGGSPWYKDRPSRNMSLQPEQATPERVAQENEAARKHGTGAYYTPDGQCWLPTRRSRANEMRRRGFQDNEAGFGDYAGR